jgi:DNA-directed RNA polymerase subunit omega
MRIEQTVAKALENVNGDRYLLSLVISKRANELEQGAEPLVAVDKKKDKLTDIALKELAEGVVNFEALIDKV